MTRATRAQINLRAIAHNLQVARAAAPNSRHMAIIKANGYGHGLLAVARALREANAFGVATLEEAISLREGGVPQDIVLLEGFSSLDELHMLRAYHLQTVVHNETQIDMLEAAMGKPVHVWLKIDTGMHRLGIAPTELPGLYARLQANERVATPIRMMTHFACADARDNPMTTEQIDAFRECVTPIGVTEYSLANSAGILGWPASHADWVRPGVMLYGVSPFGDTSGAEHGLQPAMSLHSHLIAIKQLNKDDTIGYGADYRCPHDMPVGVVAIGYGDGYPRHARSGTPVLINGRQVPLVGRVSMDMITVDLSDCPDAQLDDEVILWGEGLPVETIAQHADTIAYELLCGVTQRVRFEYSE